MGVPALFRWLTAKYPKTTTRVRETKVNFNGEVINTALPNPNGFETDNLYLDMNGIIHPCCHSETEESPATEEEMFLKIFAYTDRLFSMVRPRKLLYFAVDGVAPRAKLNQQRARRFRAAQEAEEKAKAEAIMESNLLAIGASYSNTPKPPVFDKNCITPGTRFMANLKLALEYYIIDNLSNNPGWRYIQVILSDSSVPGEGEHKIMSFIRHQKHSPTYNPNTSHVIYGLDADLIMLALATHEVNFKVLREDVFFEEFLRRKKCESCGRVGHKAADCFLSPKEAAAIKQNPIVKPFIFLDISALRNQLYLQFTSIEDKDTSSALLQHFNFERVIDDWIFLIFFVGNDFLPHLPSLEIREGAIDMLVNLYKSNFHKFQYTGIDGSGYLTNEGRVNIAAVKILLQEIGLREDDIFIQRKVREDKEESRQNQGDSGSTPIKATKTADVSHFKPISFVPAVNQSLSASVQKSPEQSLEETLKSLLKIDAPSDLIYNCSNSNKPTAEPLDECTLLEIKLKKMLKLGSNENDLDNSNFSTSANISLPEDIDIVHPMHDELEELNEAELLDARLWEPGYKVRYYQCKFGVFSEVEQFKLRHQVVDAYIQGLCWVMAYYYRGCVSWNWYYPYHYAPFASDFELVDAGKKIEFTLGQPFRPFEQLLGVLPAASHRLLPEPYHRLMNDPLSELIDFYPLDFQVDLNGKKQAWKAVILLSFIEEKRLLAAAKSILPQVSEKDRLLNEFGAEVLFVSMRNSLSPMFEMVYTEKLSNQQTEGLANNRRLRLNPRYYKGTLDGFISPNANLIPPEKNYACGLSTLPVHPVTPNRTISAVFHPPFEHHSLVFKSELLPNAKSPASIVERSTYSKEKGGEPVKKHVNYSKKIQILNSLANAMAPSNGMKGRSNSSFTPKNRPDAS